MPTIKISGMRCGHCVGSVTNALSEIDGITDVTVDLENNEATYTENTPSQEAVEQAIKKIGFEVTK